jgi:hypothetical protein
MKVQRIILVVVCLGLACGGVACAPPRIGPTAGSGYVFSVQVSDTTHVQGVWLNHAIFAPEEVIFLGLECRLDKSVLLKTEML